MNQRNYKDALVELSEAVRLNPQHALALNARGFVYYLVGDYPHSLADLDAAIQLNPSYRNAYQNRALTRKAMGDLKGSQDDVARARSAN